MAGEEIDLEELKARLHNLRLSIDKTRWTEMLASSVPALLVEETGYIIDETPLADEMFGYIQGELRGKNIKVLIPDRFHEMHDVHLARFWDDPTTRSMGSRFTEERPINIVGRKRKGEEIRLAIGLFPQMVDDARCVLVTFAERI